MTFARAYDGSLGGLGLRLGLGDRDIRPWGVTGIGGRSWGKFRVSIIRGP
jgi:hypothetical protein